MSTDGNGYVRISNRDWLTLIGVLVVHGGAMVGVFMSWSNRIVKVETKVEAITQTISQEIPELRQDVKKLLERTK